MKGLSYIYQEKKGEVIKMYDDHYNLEIYRFSSGPYSTLGAIYIINQQGKKSFTGFTLEDRFNFIDDKVPGETRIPSGIYKLKLRTEGGFHERYKKRFPFHKGMIEICGVPNFDYILIHCGNNDEHTKGCVLIGDTAEQNITKRGFIGNSKIAYERFYNEIIPGLGEGSTIKIVDGDDV